MKNQKKWGRSILNPFSVGIFLVLLCAIGYGFIPILAVYAYQGGATVSEYVFLRYAIASVFLLLYVAFYKPYGFKMFLKTPVVLPLVAGVFQAVWDYLYMFAVKSISAGLAAILFYTFIVWVAVWGFLFYKERLKVSGIVGIALTLVGLALVAGISWGKINTIGIIAALAGALFCSGYVMISNKSMEKLDEAVSSAFICLFTAVPLFLLGSANGTLQFQMSAEGWLFCIASGVIVSIALFAFMAGMKRIGSTTASVLCTLELVIAVLFSALLLSEKLTALQLLGGAVILIGTVLVITAKKES
ncbi:MAG TPA: DMT family transporter [Syntrophaceticus sp.]|nr:DMT family transporter [Syntrophaceticus sp.]